MPKLPFKDGLNELLYYRQQLQGLEQSHPQRYSELVHSCDALITEATTAKQWSLDVQVRIQEFRNAYLRKRATLTVTHVGSVVAINEPRIVQMWLTPSA